MPGLIRGVARTAVIAGTATAVSNRVSRRQAGKWAAQDQQQAYEAQEAQAPQQAYPPQQPAYQPPVSAEPPSDDMAGKLAQLEQLAQLKSQGVLTEEEFARTKQQILGT